MQDEEVILSILTISMLLFVVLGWIWPAIWMYRDSKSRGKEAVLWLIIGLIAPIVGPIVWWAIRDDPPSLRAPPAHYGYPPLQYYPHPQYYPPPQYHPQPQYTPHQAPHYRPIEVIEIDTNAPDHRPPDER